MPERAIVPRLSMTSSRLMPMPLSVTESIAPLGIDASRECRARDRLASSSGRARLSNRSRSLASDALEISSRRKISRSLYSECTMRCSSCLTSA